MNWSISNAQMFSQCPRKWYFANLVVNSKAQDFLQKETEFLKSIQSIYAWRGKVVDTVISEYLVPKVNRKEALNEQTVIDYAKELATRQIQLVRRGESDFRLLELEYHGKIDGSLLSHLIGEIELSLKNFLKSNFLTDFYENGIRLVAQRLIQCKVGNITIFCRPDAIAIYKNKLPIIADWKVKQSSGQDHLKQLALYAFVISKANPHSDLKEQWERHLLDPTKIDLLEFQLLHGRERLYSIDKSQLVDIEDFIYLSSNQMITLVEDKKYPQIHPKEIPTTLNPIVCSRCQFKRVCWEQGNDRK